MIKNIWTSRVAPNDPEIFVCSVETPNVSHYTRRPFLGDCGGAGLTKMDAKAAAIGETVERYSASIYRHRELMLGTYREVSTDREAVSPKELPTFHERQYEYLDYTRFTEDTKIAWVEGWSLSEGVPTYVPACVTYLPYFPQISEGEEAILPSVSTGCACGRSYEEAVLNGLYEVIERDVFTIMWLNRIPCPQIRLCESRTVGELFAEKLDRPGLEYHLFHGRLGLDIPCMFCVLVDQTTTPPMTSVGAAVSLDPNEAALEALIEAAHTRKWGQQLDSEHVNGTFREDYRDVRSFEDHVLLYATGGVEGATDFLFRNTELQALEEVPDRSTGEVRADLQKTISIVSDAGFQVHVVDVTSPDIDQLGLTVVRVVVPGLQPLNGAYSERILGNDRLYDLPVWEGYREKRPSTDDLNPHPHPFP